MAMRHIYVYDTKISPPNIGEHLHRPRLSRQLNGILDHKLTLICAPAGSGKTTLLSEFAATEVANVIWYRLDRRDRDVAVLAECLLQAAAPHVGLLEFGDDPLADKIGTEAVLPTLVQALSGAAAALDDRLVVILDDYEKVTGSQATNELIAGLIELTPPGIHLVICSRSAPELPLARLRLNGDMLELSGRNLALDAKEVSELLIDWRALPLSESEIDLVLSKTSGWMAGICMLSESLKGRNRDDGIAFLRSFNGSSRLVYDYFAEEVLGQQTPRVREFLLSTSLLNELHRDLVNPFLGITNAQEMLETLAANNLFLISHDESRDWYKYHPLFQEFLRTRAKRYQDKSAIARAHQRAAAAYTAMEIWGPAIDHLCEAGSYTEAANIIERVGDQHAERGNLETVRHWLKMIPDSLRYDRPRLLAVEGRIAHRQGRYEQAKTALIQAQTLFAERGDSDGLARVVNDRALVCYHTGNYREALDLLECTLGSAPNPNTRSEMLGTLCLTYKQLGELKLSARVGEAALQALAEEDAESRPGMDARTRQVLAQAYLLRGDLDRALTLSLQARDLRLAEQPGGIVLGWILWTLGMVRSVRGEFALALQALKEADLHGGQWVKPQRVRISLWRGNCYTDMGDLAAAEECYQAAGRPTAEISWLHIRQGKTTLAVRIASEGLERLTGSEPSMEQASASAVLGLALGATGQIQEALGLLQDAAKVFSEKDCLLHLTSTRLHIARMQIDCGQREQGLRTLHEALTTAESQSYYHFYWWNPDWMGQLLCLALDDCQIRSYISRLADLHKESVSHHVHSALQSNVISGEVSWKEPDEHDLAWRQLKDMLTSCTDATTKTQIELAVAANRLACDWVVRLRNSFGLTWREIEVFLAYYVDRQDPEGDPEAPMRRQLAERLCMTENTLKSHIKSIRRRLDLPAGANRVQVCRLVTGKTRAS